MANFHFVEDYEAHLKHLLATKPLDEAMSEAIGGSYELIGEIESKILLYAGLKAGNKLIDYGCGSGRLANFLSRTLNVNYLGIDILDDFLSYAASKSPAEYQFLNHRELNVPAESNSVEMISAFSLFTHLLHTETYIYMEDMYRVLKPKGILVFTFLEFNVESNWQVFELTVNQQKTSTIPHLNMFIERNVIQTWAKHLGYKIIEFVSGEDDRFFEGRPLGQSVAILEKEKK